MGKLLKEWRFHLKLLCNGAVQFAEDTLRRVAFVSGGLLELNFSRFSVSHAIEFFCHLRLSRHMSYSSMHSFPLHRSAVTSITYGSVFKIYIIIGQ